LAVRIISSPSVEAISIEPHSFDIASYNTEGRFWPDLPDGFIVRSVIQCGAVFTWRYANRSAGWQSIPRLI